MDLTRRMRGKQIAVIMTNGHVLSMRLEDGSEVNITWVDDNGRAIKGKPHIETVGLRLRAEGMREIIHANAAGLN